MDRSAVAYVAVHAEGADGAPVEEEFEIMGAPPTDVLGGESRAPFGSEVAVVFREGLPSTEGEREWVPMWRGLRETLGVMVPAGTAPGAEEGVAARRGAADYLWLASYGLEQELAETRSRADALERELVLRERERQLAAADALLSAPGMFIAQKIGESEGGVLIDDVAANLEGPEGWVVIGRLMKAGLVDENGRSFYLTREGEELVGEIQGLRT